MLGNVYGMKRGGFCSVSCPFEFRWKRTSRHCMMARSCSWERGHGHVTLPQCVCSHGIHLAGFSSVFYKISLPQPPSSCLNRAYKQSERCWIIHPLSSLPQITDLGAKNNSRLICSEVRKMRRAGRPLDRGLHSTRASSWQADELQSALLLRLGHAVVITGDLFWRNPQTGLLTNETSFSVMTDMLDFAKKVKNTELLLLAALDIKE